MQAGVVLVIVTAGVVVVIAITDVHLFFLVSQV